MLQITIFRDKAKKEKILLGLKEDSDGIMAIEY